MCVYSVGDTVYTICDNEDIQEWFCRKKKDLLIKPLLFGSIIKRWEFDKKSRLYWSIHWCLMRNTCRCYVRADVTRMAHVTSTDKVTSRAGGSSALSFARLDSWWSTPYKYHFRIYKIGCDEIPEKRYSSYDFSSCTLGRQCTPGWGALSLYDFR